MQPISSSESKISSPLLSIIVPVYNAAPFLKRCVDSILLQDYTNLEIILIDDGSTDDSWNICQAYKRQDARVIIRQQPNSGSSVARNRGLELVRGAFIGFVDSDDYIAKEMFSSMLSFAIEHDLEVVECGLAKSSDNVSQNTSKIKNSFIETREEAMERLIREKNWSVWRRIYKREVIDQLRFIPGKIHQDVFFTVDVINKIDRQGYLENAFYIYNTDNESITRSSYNMKKLDAKDAPYHVCHATRHYNHTVKTLASRYLVGTLLSHYDRLFSHSHLDPKFIHRKAIRKEIIAQLRLNYKNSSIFAVLAKFLPLWAYGWLLKINALRIKIKLMLLKL